MPRIELNHIDDDVQLRLDTATRQRLASVLADWLSVYAGVAPVDLSTDDFDLVVEVRRVLLLPDEAAAPHLSGAS